MHELLSTLAKWPGQRATKPLLEAKGYRLPELYKQVIVANCDGSDEAQLERYWDEASREYLCSAGLVRSDERKFGSETSYRSAYLDDLFAQYLKKYASTRRLSLNECIDRFYHKTLTPTKSGLLFGGVISNKLEEAKNDEIQQFGISAPEWTGTKRDFDNYLGKIAQKRGFSVKKRKWRKVFGNGLVFGITVDVGMKTTWKFHLPLVFEITHQAAPELVMQTWEADPLMPGFRYYRMFRSPESAILGIQAYVDLMCTIGDLIASQS